MKRSNVIASMELVQPYTGIVVNAVGVPSKFENYVKTSNNQDLLDKFLKHEELESQKKGADKKTISELSKAQKELKLSKADLIRGNVLATNQKAASKLQGPTLDPWQKKAIEVITQGKSTVIFGPTAGGKTYVVKYAINSLSSSGKRAIFVAPTFHLALQTYADIQATYSGFPASLITDKLCELSPDSWILVGTAETLLNYLIGNNLTYDIGIFDEIHSISTSIFEDKERIAATHTILSMCKSQIIALSATVSDDDKKKVVSYLKSRTGFSAISSIAYEERAVPQKFYTFSNNDIKTLSDKPDSTTPDLSPKNFFKLIMDMRARGMFPALLFGMKNITYSTFCDLISYMEVEEQREYRYLHNLADSVNESITEFNEAVNEFLEKIGGKTNMDEKLIRQESVLKERRIFLIQTICQKTMDLISRTIEEGIPTSYPVNIPNWNEKIYIKDVDFEEITPSPCLVDLCETYRSYEVYTWTDNTIEPLPFVSETKGSFFRFGVNTHNVFSKTADKSSEKTRGIITEMAKAEGLDEKRLNRFISLIIRGLDFGITALLKEFPFFIQYQILEMLKNKTVAAVFTNEGMSMGINYPLRSVLIFSDTNQEYPLMKLLQMAGRCGRRGFDKKAYVVFWGIRNSHEIEDTEVEDIDFPTEEYSLPLPEDLMATEDKNLLQNLYLRYHSTFSKTDEERHKKFVKKYRDLCVKEYRENYKLDA